MMQNDIEFSLSNPSQRLTFDSVYFVGSLFGIDRPPRVTMSQLFDDDDVTARTSMSMFTNRCLDMSSMNENVVFMKTMCRTFLKKAGSYMSKRWVLYAPWFMMTIHDMSSAMMS